MNLGQLELVSTNLGWRVQLCSRVLLASSTTNVNASRLHRLITAGPSGLGNTPELWIFRGRSLDLQLNLNLEDGLDVNDADIVTEAFSAGLMDTKFWAPLQLLPVSTKVSTNDDQRIQIVLSLAAVEDCLSRKPHKLHHNVSIHDVQPPSGVQSVLLESVHLDIYITQYTFKKPRKIADHGIYCTLTSDKRKFDGCISPRLGDIFPDGHILDLNNNMSARPMTRCYLKKLRMLSSYPESMIDAHCGGKDNDMLLPSETGIATRYQAQSVGRSTSNLSEVTTNTHSGTYHDENNERLHGRRTTLLNFLDAILRHTITSKPRRIAKCVRMSRKESFTPLEHLSPATWLPGHLKAMASRSAFLPTIGHAIASIGSSSVTAPALKLKLSELARREAVRKFSGAAAISIEQIGSFQELICARLWNSMDRQLSKRNSTNSLKTLHRDDDLRHHFTRSGLQTSNDSYSTEKLHPDQFSEEFGDTDLLDDDEMFIDGLNSEQGDFILDDADFSDSMKFDGATYYESPGNVKMHAIESMLISHEGIRHLSSARALPDGDDDDDLLFDGLISDQDGGTPTKNIMAETLFDSEQDFDPLFETAGNYGLRI